MFVRFYTNKYVVNKITFHLHHIIKTIYLSHLSHLSMSQINPDTPRCINNTNLRIIYLTLCSKNWKLL